MRAYAAKILSGRNVCGGTEMPRLTQQTANNSIGIRFFVLLPVQPVCRQIGICVVWR